VPESPPLVLPGDWEDRVREAGAISFRTSSDRAATFTNLLAALRSQADESSKIWPLLSLENEKTAPFLGLGFGFQIIEMLFESLEHEHVLSWTDFWLDIQSALAVVADFDASRKHLQAAADRLLAAREVLYPVTIHLVDIALLDDKRPAASLPASVAM